MVAGGVERQGVAETELRVERGADGDQIGELVATDNTAETVRGLDVEVDRERVAARISASSAAVTSEGTLIVVAPSPASTISAAGFEGAIATEIFQPQSAGQLAGRLHVA